MNKTSFIAGIVGLTGLLSMATPVQAGLFDKAKQRFNNVIQNAQPRRDNRKDRKEDFKENLRENVASRPAFVRALKRIKTSVVNGVLTAITGTTLTVESNGKSYTVLTGTFDTCTTKIKRFYWGTSDLSEYTVGDKLNIYGTWQDEGKTTIEACVIRDRSIQKRFGVFVGEVLSLTNTGWVMKPVGVKRSNQTITVTGSTKYTNRREQAITQADIKVGHRVKVKGMWNRVNNTVTEVTKVKDYSLPARVTGTVTPTPTPTPVVTATPTATPVVTATPTVTPTATPTPASP